MKLAAAVFLMASLAVAQRGSGAHRSGVLYPGARGARSGSSRFIVPPPLTHPAHATGVLVPIPVYYGAGYYGYDPNVPLDAQSAPAYDSDPNSYAAQNQSPVVVINQGYVPETANPSFQDYSDADLPPAPQTDPRPTIYLIAMKDHTIVAAIGYWVDGDALKYLTQDGNQNSVSLALVDRDFSKQLNDERNVEFRLPKQD